jgi:hypothetical protein
MKPKAMGEGLAPLMSKSHAAGSGLAAPAAQSSRPPASPLVDYALGGLRRCWMPDHGMYSHRYRFDVSGAPNESIPARDAFYTLNVLLGLSQCPAAPTRDYLDIKTAYDECCNKLRSAKVRTYVLGIKFGPMCWEWCYGTGARLDIQPPGSLIDRVGAILASPGALHRSTTQDTGMLLSGITELALRQGGRWRAAWRCSRGISRGITTTRSVIYFMTGGLDNVGVSRPSPDRSIRSWRSTSLAKPSGKTGPLHSRTRRPHA